MKNVVVLVLVLLLAGCGSNELQKQERIEIKRDMVTDIVLKSDETYKEDIVFEPLFLGVTAATLSDQGERVDTLFGLMEGNLGWFIDRGYRVTVHREKRKMVDSAAVVHESVDSSAALKEERKTDVNNVSAASGTKKSSWLVSVLLALAMLGALWLYLRSKKKI